VQAHFALCGSKANVKFDSTGFVEALLKKRQEDSDVRFMASDGIEAKMSGTNLRPGTVREIVDETATNLIELSGVI
jgi:diaminopimelate epimerase